MINRNNVETIELPIPSQGEIIDDWNKHHPHNPLDEEGVCFGLTQVFKDYFIKFSNANAFIKRLKESTNEKQTRHDQSFLETVIINIKNKQENQININNDSSKTKTSIFVNNQLPQALNMMADNTFGEIAITYQENGELCGHAVIVHKDSAGNFTYYDPNNNYILFTQNSKEIFQDIKENYHDPENKSNLKLINMILHPDSKTELTSLYEKQNIIIADIADEEILKKVLHNAILNDNLIAIKILTHHVALPYSLNEIAAVAALLNRSKTFDFLLKEHADTLQIKTDYLEKIKNPALLKKIIEKSIIDFSSDENRIVFLESIINSKNTILKQVFIATGSLLTYIMQIEDKNKKHALLKFALDNGVNPDSRLPHGMTPIRFAYAQKDKVAMRLLLQAGSKDTMPLETESRFSSNNPKNWVIRLYNEIKKISENLRTSRTGLFAPKGNGGNPGLTNSPSRAYAR